MGPMGTMGPLGPRLPSGKFHGRNSHSEKSQITVKFVKPVLHSESGLVTQLVEFVEIC